MSYSRWGYSIWYTYWEVSDSIYKDDQIFSVDCRIHFSYAELRDDMEKCLEKVESLGGKDVTDLDLEELKLYMKRFMRDVENDKDLK